MTLLRYAGMVGVVVLFAGCTQQVSILVPDMMCEESCAATVHELLAKQPGVKQVAVDYPARTATISIDNAEFDAGAAIAVLVDHGFENSTLESDAAPSAALSDLR